MASGVCKGRDCSVEITQILCYFIARDQSTKIGSSKKPGHRKRYDEFREICVPFHIRIPFCWRSRSRARGLIPQDRRQPQRRVG
jgi:hypothetical protein